MTKKKSTFLDLKQHDKGKVAFIGTYKGNTSNVRKLGVNPLV